MAIGEVSTLKKLNISLASEILVIYVINYLQKFKNRNFIKLYVIIHYGIKVDKPSDKLPCTGSYEIFRK